MLFKGHTGFFFLFLFKGKGQAFPILPREGESVPKWVTLDGQREDAGHGKKKGKVVFSTRHKRIVERVGCYLDDLAEMVNKKKRERRDWEKISSAQQ